MASKQKSNRSRTPQSAEFLKFISENWADAPRSEVPQWEVAQYAAKRRGALAKKFKGKVLVIEAGGMKTRSNDTEYRYRPHTAFHYLTGWGTATVPDSVLVIDATSGKTQSTLCNTHNFGL